MSAALSISAFEAPAAAEPFKSCRCGAHYSQSEWKALPLIGIQTVPGDDKCGAEHYECRNCSRCKSTLAVLIAPVPATDRGLCPLGCVGGIYAQQGTDGAIHFLRCGDHAA